MAAIHYKSPQSTVTAVCGMDLRKQSIGFTQRPQAVTCAQCQKHQDVVRAHSAAIDRASRQTYSVAEIRNGTGFQRGARFQKIDPAPAAQPPKSTVTISLEIDPQMAWALAQFCKRSTFETFSTHASGKDEAYLMRDGLNLVGGALRDNGFDPR